ncbi:sugar nucleotide-binding protein [Pelagibacterales bacterium SAG-MED01]|nr:sugar nucleotide-binding protein [Pelagibacterales bacterium SAG-MED01]
MTKIIITGGTGRFGNVLKKYKTKHKLFFPTKNQLNILNITNIKKYLKKTKPKILIHLAGLSRPMKLHKTNIHKSIDLNIIGTANITKVCAEHNVKLIYFSTNYVYQGIKGNYLETDPVLPVNNYAWSKLGGEASVQLYKNSLILRLSMTEKPFVHKKAFVNVKNSFLYHDEVVRILFKLIKSKGVINVGGNVKNIYDFVKKDNPKVKKVFLKKKSNLDMPINSSINISKLKKILKKK